MKTGEPQRSFSESQRRHELAERLEVALLAEVLVRIRLLAFALLRRALLLPLLLALLVGLDDAAEAGADGVDEDEVGEREPRGLVLDELRRQLGQRPVGRKVDALRADGAHVQERGRGARPAVEDERDGPRRGRRLRRRTRRRRSRRRASPSCAGRPTSPSRCSRVASRRRSSARIVSAPAGGSWSCFGSASSPVVRHGARPSPLRARASSAR